MKQVRALVLRQKDTTLYSFCMNAMELEPLCFVEAASRDHQKGLQRVTEPSRLKDIAEYLGDEENGFLPNNIIVNLKSEVTISPDTDGTMATISFPSTAGEYAFVVDGQHRLFSFRDEYRKLNDRQPFQLPVVAFHNASDELVGATFVSINVNQKPVNRNLLTQMKAILGLLDSDHDKAAIDLVHELERDPASPFHNRILRFPNEKHKWVKTNQLLGGVKGLLLPGGCLHLKTHAERKRILVAYLMAFSDTFPEAWADVKRAEYSLLQASSLQITVALLPDLMQRCDFYEGFSYTYDTFKTQLEPLRDLALLGQWRKAAVDEALSTKPKRQMFLGQIREALRVKPPSA
jgi:DGQHR domain-containing protein